MQSIYTSILIVDLIMAESQETMPFERNAANASIVLLRERERDYKYTYFVERARALSTKYVYKYTYFAERAKQSMGTSCTGGEGEPTQGIKKSTVGILYAIAGHVHKSVQITGNPGKSKKTTSNQRKSMEINSKYTKTI